MTAKHIEHMFEVRKSHMHEKESQAAIKSNENPHLQL